MTKVAQNFRFEAQGVEIGVAYKEKNVHTGMTPMSPGCNPVHPGQGSDEGC